MTPELSVLTNSTLTQNVETVSGFEQYRQFTKYFCNAQHMYYTS